MKNTDPFKTIPWIGDLSFFGMIKSIHELWGPPPLITSHYGGFFPHSFGGLGNPEEGETIFFPPLLAKIGLHVVIGNHLPGRAMALPTMGWRLSWFCHVLFWWKFVEHFELYFLFCWMDFDGIWRRMKKLNGFLIDMISIFGSLRVLLFQGMAFLNNSGVWFEGTGNSTCRN